MFMLAPLYHRRLRRRHRHTQAHSERFKVQHVCECVFAYN